MSIQSVELGSKQSLGKAASAAHSSRQPTDDQPTSKRIVPPLHAPLPSRYIPAIMSAAELREYQLQVRLLPSALSSPAPWVNATLTILRRYIARVRRGGPQDGSRKLRAPVSRRRAQRSHLTDGSGSRGTERWREPECSIADDDAEHQHARVQIRQQQQRGDSSGERRRGK
jgi:hypothetical protein